MQYHHYEVETLNAGGEPLITTYANKVRAIAIAKKYRNEGRPVYIALVEIKETEIDF